MQNGKSGQCKNEEIVYKERINIKNEAEISSEVERKLNQI